MNRVLRSCGTTTTTSESATRFHTYMKIYIIETMVPARALLVLDGGKKFYSVPCRTTFKISVGKRLTAFIGIFLNFIGAENKQLALNARSLT